MWLSPVITESDQNFYVYQTLIRDTRSFVSCYGRLGSMTTVEGGIATKYITSGL